MGVYCSLRQSADTGDNEARSWMGRIMALNSELAAADAAARQYIAALPELPELMQPGHGFDEYRYLLEQLRRNASHLLAPGEEAVLARMSLSGASAWSQLQETLTSTVEVPPTAAAPRPSPPSATWPTTPMPPSAGRPTTPSWPPMTRSRTASPSL